MLSGINPFVGVSARGAASGRAAKVLRATSVSFLVSDIMSFGLACLGVLGAVSFTRRVDWTGPATAALQHGAAWHGWGTILVFGILLIQLNSRGHYTHRIPFWTELADVLRAAAQALVLDFFITVAVYGVVYTIDSGLRWALFAPLLMGMRELARLVLNRAGFWNLKTLIIGPANATASARAALESEPSLGLPIVAVATASEVAAIGTPSPWAEILRRCGAEFAVIIVGGSENEAERTVISDIARTRIPFALIPCLDCLPVLGFTPHYFFSHNIMMLVNRNNLARPLTRALKLVFDITGALVVLLLLSPLMIGILLLVRSDGGPVLYRQERIGMNGRRFNCLKFRSMRTDADEALRSILESNPQAREEWQTSQKLRNDPRVTPIGALLRATSLDELPQLLNVIRGEMSLVGPRPIVEKEIERYGQDIDFYYQTRPGMTGLWQVSGRSNTSYPYRVQLDTWYVRNWTVWHDAAIIIKTIPAVLLRAGAV